MDIILLIFLCIHIGKAARRKGLNVAAWRWRLVFVWLGFEFMGLLVAVMLFGFQKDNLFGLAAFALACAFGGYLMVKASLDRKAGEVGDDRENTGD